MSDEPRMVEFRVRNEALNLAGLDTEGDPLPGMHAIRIIADVADYRVPIDLAEHVLAALRYALEIRPNAEADQPEAFDIVTEAIRSIEQAIGG